MAKHVTSPNNDPGSIERAKKNESIMSSQVFKDACEKVGIPATRRQASKFRNKRGKAYKLGR